MFMVQPPFSVKLVDDAELEKTLSSWFKLVLNRTGGEYRTWYRRWWLISRIRGFGKVEGQLFVPVDGF